MTPYTDHFNALLDAYLRAVPTMSGRAISLAAGLNPGWLSDFRKTGVAKSGAMDAVAAVVRGGCPTGPQGDEVRRLLAVFDQIAPSTERDAA